MESPVQWRNPFGERAPEPEARKYLTGCTDAAVIRDAAGADRACITAALGLATQSSNRAYRSEVDTSSGWASKIRGPGRWPSG